jgi:hypothetical protein
MNLAQVAGEAAISGLCALANSGTLVFYSGSQPATPETALSGNTALATWTFNSTAFGAASISGGYAQAAANFTASSVTPSANGTVTFARMYESNGTTVIADFTVGTSGTDIVIGNTSISTTISVSLSVTLQLPVV